MLQKKIILLLVIIKVFGLYFVYMFFYINQMDASIFKNNRLYPLHGSPQRKRIHRETNTLSSRVVNRSVADSLAQSVRILCWVMTCPANHRKKARHVKQTWGKRCNVLLFMSSVQDNDLPTIKLPVKEGREYLWGKTLEAFKYIYEQYRHDADWFLKADDDTYVIMENLRFLLSKYDPQNPLFFGYLHIRNFMNGGAGYVLSRNALDIWMNKPLDRTKCRTSHSGDEDVVISKCMRNCGVQFIDPGDPLLRNRFFSFQPIIHIFKEQSSIFSEWYNNRRENFEDSGFNCCSEYSISFHYIRPFKMYEMDYLLYTLRPYGITHTYTYHRTETSSQPSPMDDLLPTVKLNVTEGRNYLWGKTKESFRYIYKHYRYDADWFLKADDDTYVVMENLRYFLSQQNPQSHAYFGHLYNGYMAGGAGYVLSRPTLNLLVNKGLRSTSVCKKSNVGPEDLILGTCLKRYHVEAVPSFEPRTGADPFDRKLFFQHPPLVGNSQKYEQIYNDTNLTFKCCSKLTISFHYITPNKMYELEYLIYKLRPYGVSYRDG